MKRVKTVNQVGVRQSLLLAGLILASTAAQAAVLPKITVTGVGAGQIASGVTSVTVAPVPEAETSAMMLAGLGLVGYVVRRRTAA